MKKYIAAYLERNAKPNSNPNKKKFKSELFERVSKSLVIAIVQNNNNNKSVEIKKEDKLADGIIRKLIAHSKDLFLENDKDLQSLKTAKDIKK